MQNKDTNDRQKIIKELLDVTDTEFTDEELIHQLITTNFSKNSEDTKNRLSLGQKASDAVAKFAGSWAFIFSFIAVMVIWMVLNVVLASKAFDAYPFILLNLVLSCIAAVQAPLIKTELILDDLHKKLDEAIENQNEIKARINALEKKDEKKGV